MDRKKLIVNLNGKKDGDIVFCIHPVSGEVVYYQDLAKIFQPKFSVYGIKSLMLENNATMFQPIEDIAAEYIKIIRECMGEKPYSLIGWSMGGIIAFEMGKQLALSHKNPSAMVLLDTYEPTLLPSFRDMDMEEFYYHLTRMLHSGAEIVRGKNLINYQKLLLTAVIKLKFSLSFIEKVFALIGLKNLKNDLWLLKNNLENPNASREPILEWLSFGRRHHLIPEKISESEILSHYQAMRSYMAAYKNYKIGYYDGNIIFVQSKYGYKHYTNKNDWKPFCKSVKNYIALTDHYHVVYDKKSLQFLFSELSR